MIIASALLSAATAFAAVPSRPTPTASDTMCIKQKIDGIPPDTLSSKERSVSPLDSVTFKVGGKPVKVCYGRPSARGRVMIGGLGAPYGKLWRTGANEPTIFFTPITLSVAGLTVPPGAYSLYTLPGETEWVVVVNRSVSHWGSSLNQATQSHELGRATVKREWLPNHVETLTIRPEPNPARATALVIEWEWTHIRIPVAAK